jgi:hypothetical protein
MRLSDCLSATNKLPDHRLCPSYVQNWRIAAGVGPPAFAPKLAVRPISPSRRFRNPVILPQGSLRSAGEFLRLMIEQLRDADRPQENRGFQRLTI